MYGDENAFECRSTGLFYGYDACFGGVIQVKCALIHFCARKLFSSSLGTELSRFEKAPFIANNLSPGV